MTTSPDRLRTRLPEISTRAWEHPADRTALVALRSLGGFDLVLRTMSGLLRERQYRLMYLATAVRVGERQFRYLHQLRQDCVEILDAPTTPELFVVQSPEVNAFTIGMDKPFIVLTTGLVDLLDHEEMRFTLGHELGHAMSGHAVYRTMLMHLLRMADGLGWMPIGGWALRAIVAALMEWSRKSELSGDRAGLLCGQDVEASVRVHMKLAGGARVEEMNHGAFLAQADDYERSGDLRDGVLKLLNLELQSHPFSVLRAAELRRWIQSGDYERILGGDYPRRAHDKNAKISEEIKQAARSYRDTFDQSEDPLIRTVRTMGRDMGAAVNSVGQEVGGAVADLGKRFTEWRRGSDSVSE
ncbi:M48 family metallopeptidase [Nocardia cyriacigeorgica]|uniref:Peptidase, M48 family protein n=1 Tax=Nocardia cyriacigeorgica (strain GUH-2) TaxID=1127134 RepID=H6R7R9_NOCCG|nr:M48 family metallopeptidase [Nocardia cyriacigeorgica]MBF6286443.1 M48 family metallopeptidase [Nocardia cyriacigeorgica]MBF6427392.1 M48 family metallopeptidase [Nocardia cyriacigeorgica]BDU05360.1 Zn-dependent protease [Nocardia cyriacigeorgica]CCF62263.1 Peptidase, M48 family protein [Nocardia cyriacigeorgica GUH-2]